MHLFCNSCTDSVTAARAEVLLRFSLITTTSHPRSQKGPAREGETETEGENSKKDEEIQKKPHPSAEDEGVVFFSIRLTTKEEEF